MELAFRSKARFHTSSALIEHLAALIDAPCLAVILDVDALQRRTPVDRVTLLALQALLRSQVHVILTSHDEQTRLSLLRRGMPLSCLSADRLRHLVADVRQRLRGVQLIAVADERDVIPLLLPHDRRVDVGTEAVRAVLWWLVNSRVLLTT